LIPIGAALREARLRKGLSLEEIAAGINLNAKFLDQIERGILPSLPEPYIKGILNSFASRVGVNLDEIPEIPDPPTDSPPATPAPPVDSQPPNVAPRRHGYQSTVEGRTQGGGYQGDIPVEKARGYQRAIIGGFVFLTIVSLGISIVWMNRESNTRPVQEISFQDAVKEQESKYAAETARSDSLARSQDAALQLARGDSITLEGRATDTVTVTVAVDHAKPHTIVIAPLHSAQWTAEKTFLVSVENPSAVEFSLNGVRLSSVSSSARPVKNLLLSRSTIEKSQARRN
jgi:cytoskeletal protein RodZ